MDGVSRRCRRIRRLECGISRGDLVPGVDLSCARWAALRGTARIRRGRLCGDGGRHGVRAVLLDWRRGLVHACRQSRTGVSASLRRHLPFRGHHRHAGHRPVEERDLRGGRRTCEWQSRAQAGRPVGHIGRNRIDQDVDPPAADPAALLQRTGLTLDAGQVVFGMGGNFGDCATYRGRVVAVAETGGSPTFFTVDASAGDSQGAIWMGGAAPAVDGDGDIWVSAGNGSVYSASQPYDDSDSALELSSSLQLLQYFAPTTWPQDNAHDLDMSMAPALLPSGQVLLAGKSRIAYLLNGAHLGGIGGQEASLAAACSEDIDGGSAVVGTTVYLPCPSGPVAVRATTSPASLTLLWSRGSAGGRRSSRRGWCGPSGRMARCTGSIRPQERFSSRLRSVCRRTTSRRRASATDSCLRLPVLPSSPFMPSRRARPPPASRLPTAPTTVTTHPQSRTSAAPASGAGGTSAGEIAGIVAGVVIVLTGAGWLLARRRRRVAGS